LVKVWPISSNTAKNEFDFESVMLFLLITA
jgi:hypothetical protein